LSKFVVFWALLSLTHDDHYCENDVSVSAHAKLWLKNHQYI